VLRDMLRIIFDRYPNLRVIVRPSPVQGNDAAAEIVRAIDDLNRDGRAEVIIVARGGGSLEDLWPFNEEAVARAIRRSSIPVISAIGHEVDYTIADFAADLRAPTPSAAAQSVVPIKAELRQRLDAFDAALLGLMRSATGDARRRVAHLAQRIRDPHAALRQARQRLDEAGLDLARSLTRQLEAHRQRAIHLEFRLAPAALRARLAAQSLRVDGLARQLVVRTEGALAARRAKMAALAQQLDAVSPLRVLDRGYAVVTRLADGRVVADAREVSPGEELNIRLARGHLRAVARQP